MKRLAALCLGMVLLTGAHAETPVTPVSDLNLTRYQGSWFEIARFPNSFQTACVGGDHADYAIQPNGRVRVTNRCRHADGTVAQVQGDARLADPANPAAQARLQVRFAPAWLSWLPVVWAPYWVIVLDPDYRYAVVSEPKRQYLWILSRTPTLDPATYDAILAQLAQRGYDLSKLVKTVQP